MLLDSRPAACGAIRVATAAIDHAVADAAFVSGAQVDGRWEIDAYLDETIYGPHPIRLTHPFPVATASFVGATDRALADVVAVAVAEPDRQQVASRGLNVGRLRWEGALRVKGGMLATVVVDWS